MIRVAVLDDHPSVLAGLQRLLEGSADLMPVAAAGSADELFGALAGARVDVAIVDYDLVRGDGLGVCQRLKERLRAPGVIVYSAYAGPALALAAQIAGADALVDKRAPAGELLGTVRDVAAGGRAIPEVRLEIREALLSRLRPEDVPIAGMLLAGTSRHGIADALDVDPADVVRRVRRIVARIGPRLRQEDHEWLDAAHEASAGRA